MTLADKVSERQQIEAEDRVCSISMLYTGYDNVYKAFCRELEHCFDMAQKEKLDITDIEYLSAICLALRRETVLRHRRFV